MVRKDIFFFFLHPILCFLNTKQHLVLVWLCWCPPVVQLFPDPWAGWQQCWHGRCWAHWSNPQRRGRLRFICFIGLTLFWSKTNSHTSVTRLLSAIAESAPAFSLCGRNGGTWPDSVPRFCANTFVRGEVQQTTIIHSNTDLFFPLQLPVPLWSIPRLPMQQLALHWEFAGASSQMTLWSATSWATNPWAMRGTVMGKQVRRLGPKGHLSPPLAKPADAKVPLHAWCTVCHQNWHICHHHLLCRSSPARSAELPAAAGPITGAKTGCGSSRDSRNGKGAVDGVMRISGGWALH